MSSMSSEPVQLTQEGFDKLKIELHELKTVHRKEIAARLEVAKDLGDLSENADYQQAKEDSAWIEGRVNQLNDLISRALVAPAPQGGVASIGSTVNVQAEGIKRVFTIVGATEADPIHGKISCDSPIGSALIGVKTGNTVVVKTPAGDVEYAIVKVE